MLREIAENAKPFTSRPRITRRRRFVYDAHGLSLFTRLKSTDMQDMHLLSILNMTTLLYIDCSRLSSPKEKRDGKIVSQLNTPRANNAKECNM